MHSKRKGNIGQFAAALKLSEHGFSVFTEEGDISVIDMIAERDGRLLRIQCKASMPIKGKIELPLTKTGPGYSRVYIEEELDLFSLYNLASGQLYLISSKVLRTHHRSYILRLVPTKNQQKSGVNMAEDYLADKILRDYTSGTLTSDVEGDDIVQTTTVIGPRKLGVVG